MATRCVIVSDHGCTTGGGTTGGARLTHAAGASGLVGAGAWKRKARGVACLHSAEVGGWLGCKQVRKLELQGGAWAYEVHAQLPGISLEGIKCALLGFNTTSPDTPSA